MDILTQGTHSVYQGIPELESFSKKSTLYRHPGQMEDSLYYDKDSSSVYPIEVQSIMGRYIQTIPSPQYGGRYEVQVPNFSFVDRSEILFTMNLPTTGLTGASLPRNWGDRLLGDVILMFPSANMPSLTLENMAAWHSKVGMSQTTEGLTFYNRQAGECLANTDFSSPINFVPQDATNGKLCATVILDLPWSNICSQYLLKKGFDTTLLNNPIRINFQFNSASSIWGSYASPPSFTATFTYREQSLVNKALSLRNTLFREPGKRINYPSCWRQLQSIYFTANKPVTASYNIALSQFIASDLLGLAISVHLTNDLNPSTANTPANPYNCLEIVNPQLQFGGETLYNAPNDSWKVINACPTISGVFQDTPLTVWNGTNMVVDGARLITPLFIDFVNIRQVSRSQDFQNCVKFDSQQLNFQFNLAQNYYYLNTAGTPVAVSIANASCVLLVTAFYPQISSVESGGSVQIAFN